MNNFKLMLVLILAINSTFCLSQSSKLELKPYIFKNNAGEKIDAELGSFFVPENRSVKDGRNIKLHFVRFKSTNPNPGNPIVYLAGGPGGSGISTARGKRFKLFMALREVADVIALDQRGTGLSNHIPECKTKAQFLLDEPGKYDTYISKMSEAAKKCISFWKSEGVFVEGYNTAENANDLEALRKVLGVPKINLWGISYGSHLAFEFIKRYENSIDKVVLAGLEGPGHTIKLPKNNQNFITYLNSKIKLDSAAAKQFPNLLTLMEDVLSSLEKQPVFTEMKDPRSGKKFKVGISKLDIQLVTSYFLTKNPENSARLPYLYHQMKSGDFSEVARMVVGIKLYAGSIRLMPLIMDISSGISSKRLKQVEKQSKKSLLGKTTNFPFPYISKGLNIPDLGKEFRENPVSIIPALFFSGTLDGRTYLESAKELKKGFINGHHIIIDGAGHDLFMSTPKVAELMLDFFHNKAISNDVIKIATPKFIIPEFR